MRTETDLRDFLRGSESPGAGSLDARAVIARSKRRRLPKQIGMGGLATLAVGGISVIGIQNFAPSVAPPQIQAEDSTMGRDSSAGSSSAMERAPLDKLNLCGGPRAEVAASDTGLVATAEFPDAPAGRTAIDGAVTVVNSSGASVSATITSAPLITLTRDGIVVWHTTGVSVATVTPITLAAGEATRLGASLTPLECTSDDELGTGFGDELPALPPGRYGISAAIEVILDSTGIAETITGPESDFEVR